MGQDGLSSGLTGDILHQKLPPKMLALEHIFDYSDATDRLQIKGKTSDDRLKNH